MADNPENNSRQRRAQEAQAKAAATRISDPDAQNAFKSIAFKMNTKAFRNASGLFAQSNVPTDTSISKKALDPNSKNNPKKY